MTDAWTIIDADGNEQTVTPDLSMIHTDPEPDYADLVDANTYSPARVDYFGIDA